MAAEGALGGMEGSPRAARDSVSIPTATFRKDPVPGVVAAIALAVFFMRFAAVRVGDAVFPAALFFAWAYAVANIRRLGVDAWLLFLFLSLFAAGAVSAVLHSVDYTESVKTLAYVAMIYPLVFLRLEVTDEEFRRIIRAFQVIMVWAGIYGLLQFATRLAWNMDFLEEMVLSPLLIPGYATKYAVLPTHLALFGLPMFYKMNAVFPEPSICSQFFTFALILEIFFFRNWLRLVFFVICILLTISGSGFLMAALFGLAWSGLALATGRIPKRIFAPMIGLAALCLAVLAMVVANDSANALLVSRIGEFQTPETSAYFRFVEPFKWGVEVASSKFALLGIGPGMKNLSDRYFDFLVRDPNETTFFRVLLEFGALGLLLYVGMFARAYRSSDSPVKRILLLMVFCDLIGGGYFLSPFWGFAVFAFMLHPGPEAQGKSPGKPAPA